MSKILTFLPIIMMIGACSNQDSFESKGREADQAIETAGEKIDAEQDALEARVENVREKAIEVQQDAADDLGKIDKAIDAADAELKK